MPDRFFLDTVDKRKVRDGIAVYDVLMQRGEHGRWNRVETLDSKSKMMQIMARRSWRERHSWNDYHIIRADKDLATYVQMLERVQPEHWLRVVKLIRESDYETGRYRPKPLSLGMLDQLA